MLTDEEFRIFRNLVYEEAGIYLKESRKDYLENRLLRRMQATGAASPYRYYRHIANGGRDELMNLLDVLTINETSFFRNRPQLELLRNVILPELIRVKSQSGRKSLRLWSAGCSTGEEPFTVAILVAEALGSLRDWDVKIHASDLSLSALDTASRAEYDSDKVQATVDDRYIGRYFDRISIPDRRKQGPEGDRPSPPRTGEIYRYRLKESLRRFVVFDFHNLKNDNGLLELDMILCRNVMIYFDETEQRRLIDRFYRVLNPGGYLLIGHSESIHGWKSGLELIYANKGMAYQKKGKEN